MVIRVQIHMESCHLAGRLGIWASALCVLHCLLTPLVLSLSAVAAHFLPGDEYIHRSLALLVAQFGTVGLLRGFQVHGRRCVVAMMAGGLPCIAGAAWFGPWLPSHAWEVSITFVGSVLMIGAHRLNHTFCRRCQCAGSCPPQAAGR